MTIKISSVLANLLITARKTAIDSGGSAGSIKLYSGTQPTTVETSPTGDLLATLTLDYPCGTIDGRVLTLDINQGIATTNGTCTFARICTSAGTGVIDLAITSDFTILPNPIVEGMSITIETATLTEPL